MATLQLNKDNNFRKTAGATQADCIFLIIGATADIEVRAAGGDLVGRVQGIKAGNISSINGLTPGTRYTYEINPMDRKTANATVTY